MLMIEPDFARRIDLPGVGPCPRPVDIDRAASGLSQLVSLRIYSFAAGMVIDGEAEEDEVFITLLRGAADIAVRSAGDRFGPFALRVSAADRAAYLPPHAAYQLTAVADCDIAYARARPPAPAFPAPRSFAASDGALAVRDHAIGMALELARLDDGATVASPTGAPERLLHIRSDTSGSAVTDVTRCGDWGTLALGAGDDAAISIEGGAVDLLSIVARSP